MLDLENGLRRVLHPERNVRQRILGQGAIELLNLQERLLGGLPVLVPHGQLGQHGIGESRTRPLAGHIVRTAFRQVFHAGLEVLDEVGTGLHGRHARQVSHLFQHLQPVHVVRIIRDVAEERGQQVIVEGPHGLGLRQVPGLQRFFHGGRKDAVDAGLGIADADIALVPHRVSETRVRRGNVQLGILLAGSDGHQVRHALGADGEFEGINALERDIAGIEAGHDLGLILIEVFRRDKRLTRLFQRAGHQEPRQGKSRSQTDNNLSHSLSI